MLANIGCGLIAICDVLLYLDVNNVNGIYNQMNNDYDYQKYMKYLYTLSTEFPVFPVAGELSVQFPSELESYISNCYEKDYNISFNYSDDCEKCYSEIRKMIKNNIPVIMSFDNTEHKAYNIFLKDNLDIELSLYTTENFIDFKEEQCVKSHYMVITGIVEYSDDVIGLRSDGRTFDNMLQVSSWGRKYYISSDDYTNNLSIFSNILKINES